MSSNPDNSKKLPESLMLLLNNSWKIEEMP